MKKIAIVSGASDGIGREFARALAAQKEVEELWLIARRAERMQALGDELDIPCRLFPLDLSVPGAEEKICTVLTADEVQVTWLVASAGFGKIGEFTDLPADAARDMVTVNCTALTALIHIALPHMAAGGHVVTLASAAAFMPQPRFAVYAATKAYVLSLSRALNEELRSRGISVTAVCPGPMETEFIHLGGIKGHSKTFETLPYCDQVSVAGGALRAARAGRTIYTPKLFYKTYRVLAKVLPVKLMVKFTKT